MHNIPRIQENELLKGYVLRIHDNSINLRLSDSYKELFGKANISIDPYIPNNLDKICSQLFREKSTKEIILNHTLFGYYTAFYDSEDKNIYMERMLRPKEIVYNLKKGKELEIVKHFRYCPRCMNEQWEQAGSIFFNRIHQIVPVCTKHGIWIEESTIPTRGKLSEYISSFKVLTEIADYEERICDDLIMIEISERIEQLIKKPVEVSEQILKGVYKQRLSKLNLAYETAKSIKNQEIKNRIVEYFTEQRLSVLNVDTNKMRWIDEVVGNYRIRIHPLYHILMQMFLQIDPYKLSDEIVEIIPSVECYCLNPLSSHYKQHKIDNVKVQYSYSGKCYMCTCFCSCGFKFTTKLEDFNASGGVKIGKVQEYGKEYMEHLLQLRFLGIKGIARLTGLGVQAIRHQLKRYDAPGSIECPKKIKISNKNNACCINENKKNKETKKRRVSNDWSKKDEIYCKLAKEIVKNELEKTMVTPRRLTRTRFAKEIGNLNAILYCYDKLPHTNKVIEEYIESKEEYKVRRVQWAIDRLRERNCEISPWRILRVVRNDTWSKEEIEEVIEELTGKENQ